MNAISNMMHVPMLLAGLCGCWLPSSATAQVATPEKSGFVRLVNAVAQGQDKLQLLIDGELMNPQGYDFGDVTGGIGLKPGTHHISIRRMSVKEASTRVQVIADTTLILIPFAEWVPATADKAAHWAMRILRLKQMDPESKRTATFVSVSQTPEHEVEISAPNGNWTKVFVKRLAITRTPIHYPEGYVPLRCKSTKLAPIPIGKPGNYLVVIHDDANGNMQAINLQDYKYLSTR